MCSRNEAFGRVTVEALKLGKPCIGANSGGTPELIRDGWNGLLYETGSPSSLAEKIEVLYWNKSLREELAKSAYHWANSTLSSENCISNLIKVFEVVVEK